MRSLVKLSTLGAASVAILAASPLATRQKDARASMLVTPAWLAGHINDPRLVLLHVGTPEEYARKHIAGARFVRLEDIAQHDMEHDKLMLEMPPADDLRDRLTKLGISDDSRVIVYFGNDWVSPSTRVVLTLDYAGLGASTSLLDGGMPAWVKEGHPVTDAVTAAQVGTLAPLRIKPLIVTGEWVRDSAMRNGISLVDARDGGFYDGVMEGGPRTHRKTGHIPGAKSVPFGSVWTDSNELLPADSIATLFRNAGVRAGDTVVGYCHIGQQATAMLFAARSLGFKVLLYDGSFEDWALRDWPVEVPPKSGGKL